MGTKKKFTLGMVGGAVAVLGLATAATADESRKPFTYEAPRESTLELKRYEQPMTVVRERTEGKSQAVFSAPAQPIDRNAIMVFRIVSVAQDGREMPRWRCVAVEDVSECFGKPVKLRYLPDDIRLELTAVAKPRASEEAQKLMHMAGYVADQDSIQAALDPSLASPR